MFCVDTLHQFLQGRLGRKHDGVLGAHRIAQALLRIEFVLTFAADAQVRFEARVLARGERLVAIHGI